MNPILASFLSMFSFGITDFASAVYARKSGTWSAVFLNEVVGLFLIILIIFVNPNIVLDLVSYPFFDILLLIFASTLNFLAIACLIYGFSIGNVGVVSAIGSSFNLIVIFLTWLFLGEGLTFLGIVFLILLVVGIFISSLNFPTKPFFSKGAIWGLFAMLMWGVSFFLMIFLSRHVSLFTLLFSNFIVGFTISFIFLLITKSKVIVTKSVWLIIFSGFFELLAYIFLYLGGAVEGSAGIVGAITGSYALISVVLGYLFLKEILSHYQIIGLILILVSIFAISYYG